MKFRRTGYTTMDVSKIKSENASHIHDFIKSDEPRVIPLSEIDAFGARGIKIDELKAAYKEGFVLTEIKDDDFLFERRDV